MKQKHICIIVIIICGIFPREVASQTQKIINELIKVPWSGTELKANLTDEEKVNMLSMLPDGDSVQFENPYYEAEYSDSKYFPLDTFGLIYKDLNFDGFPDLIYSARSGSNQLASSKVYINEENVLKYYSTLRGGILDIQKTDSTYSCYTIWYPCCDSYTTRIEKYDFTADTVAAFDYSISVVGLDHLKGFPDFTGYKTICIENPSLYASPEDFRGTSPYFKKRTKDIRDSLRAGYYIKLIDLSGKLNVSILDKKISKEITWYLIITEPMNDIPKSLYEWSEGSGRRFVGWIKEEALD